MTKTSSNSNKICQRFSTWLAATYCSSVSRQAIAANRVADARPSLQTDREGEPMLMVAPITSNLAALRFSFSVRVEPSAENGLTKPSVVMVFQMRAIDKARIVRRIGRLSKEDMARIDAEIWRMLQPPAS